jgi:hypothetical protein
MNRVFSTIDFWRPYGTLDPGELCALDFASQLDSLSADYPVRAETVHFEYAGRQQSAIHRFVEFSFSCGDLFSLVVEYEPAENGCSMYLMLVDSRSGKKHEMGWWDLVQWHPYCLRLQELDCLLRFWRQGDPRWHGDELPLLLLCQFVGVCDSNEQRSLAARVESAFETLGLSGDAYSTEVVPIYIPEGAYYWRNDAELGWLFTSDDYCCYSMRNRPHADADEGQFPFAQFREMLNDVQKSP